MGQDESDDVIVAPAAGEVAAFASDLPEHLGFLSRHPHLTQVRHVGNAEVMDEARVQLCGTFAVELRGRRIDNLLTGRQGRLLFAYLVVSRLLPVSRNSLIDALWSDAPTADASGALNALISKTRAVVGGDVLRGRTELILTLPEPAQVDVEVALAKLQGIGGSELPGAERAARELVEVAPFRESGHLLLMRRRDRQRSGGARGVRTPASLAARRARSRSERGRARGVSRAPRSARHKVSPRPQQPCRRMLIFMTTTSKPTSDQFRIDDLAGICGMIITPEIRAMTRRAPSTTA